MANYEYANNPQTTLSGAVTAGATAITVASATGFPTKGKFPIIVDSEIMLVTGVSGTTWTVERGAEDTAAAAHNNNAAVTGILTKKSFLDAFHFDVRTYGAKGDGTTDDSAAVQAAIDAAAVAGGTVFFPPGTYLCNTTLTIDAGEKVQLVGAGPEVSIIRRNDANANNVLTVGGATPGTMGFRMAHLQVYGNSVSGSYGVYLDTLTEGENVIEDVRVRSCGWGIGLNKVYGFRINDSRIESNTNGGIRGIRQGVSGDTNQIVLQSLWVKNNAGPALQIECGSWQIIGGAYENPATGSAATVDNILIRGGYNITLLGVYTENSERNNVRIVGTSDGEAETPTNVTFTGCYFNNSRNNNALLHIGHSTRVLVENCRFQGASEPPINLTANADTVTIRQMRNETGTAITNSGATKLIIEHPPIFLPPTAFLAGEADGTPTNPPTLGSSGDNEYIYYNMPHDGTPAVTSVVTQIPIPLGWQDSLATLKVTIYEQANSSGSAGNIVWEYTAAAIAPTESIAKAFGSSSTLIAARDATVAKSREFSDKIVMGSTTELLRLRIGRDAASASDTYADGTRFLGAKIERFV